MCKFTGGTLYRLPKEQINRSLVISNLLGNLDQASRAVSQAKADLTNTPPEVISSHAPQYHTEDDDDGTSTEEEHSNFSHRRHSHQQPQPSIASRVHGTRQARDHSKEMEHTATSHRQSTVHHDYHDLASSPMVKTTAEQAKQSKKSKGGIAFPFPSVLHTMLERAEMEGFDEIVSWQPHGRAFMVHSPSRFVSEIMPMFFRQTRFASFQRQLSLYGFLRLTRKGIDHGAYYHELFIRGRSDLCQLMQRTRVKGSWVRQSSSPDTEPDFAAMPPVPRGSHSTPKLPLLRKNANKTFHKNPSARVNTPISPEKISTTSQSNHKMRLEPLPYLSHQSLSSSSSAVTGFGFTNSQLLASYPRPQVQSRLVSVASSQAPQSSNLGYDNTPLPLQGSYFDSPPEQATLAAFLRDVGLEEDDNDDEEAKGNNSDWYDTEPLPWNTPSTFAEI